MTRSKLLAGVASFSLLASSFGVLTWESAAVAQEAAAPVEPAPAPQQQPAPDCSGLGCLFQSRQAAAPEAQAPQPTADAAPQAGAPQAGAAQGAPQTDAAPAAGTPPAQSADAAAPGDESRPAPKKAVKPAHVVTIAAEGSEVPRLRRLAAAMPKEKIKIVKLPADGERGASDFALAAALDAPAGPDATRLFTEQMHIIAGPSVKSVQDLRGKVVSFGPDKSPGQAAARKAFEALNVRVNETPLDMDNALDGLATGDVEAVVLLAPQPIDRLRTLSAPGVHLVSWPEGASLPNGASAVTIDADAYPRLAKPGETIRAIGVDAMLTMSAKGAKQSAAKTFLKALSQHSDALAKRGFDLLKADLAERKGRHLASADRL